MITRLLPTLLVLAVAPLMAVSSAAAADYGIDPSHTTVVFKANHMNTPFYGMFRKASGNVTWDKATPATSKIAINIDARSIFTGDKKRDTHLKGPDFLDAKQFPSLTFKSTRVSAKGDTLKVTGVLTIRGKSKTIVVNVKKTFEGTNPMTRKPAVGFHANFSFKRSDFGIKYMVGKGLGDKIEVMMGLEAMGR